MNITNKNIDYATQLNNKILELEMSNKILSDYVKKVISIQYDMNILINLLISVLGTDNIIDVTEFKKELSHRLEEFKMSQERQLSEIMKKMKIESLLNSDTYAYS